MILTYHRGIEKVFEKCFLDLNPSLLGIVQGYDEMEEVAFAHIIRWLLLEGCVCNAVQWITPA